MIKYVFIPLSILCLCFTTYGQDLQISEIVASNSLSYENSEGASPDWIELKNNSNKTLQLSNYSLSVIAGKQSPWKLPNIALAPQKFILIEASNPANAVYQWQTIIDKGDMWKYYVAHTEPHTMWKSIAFNDDSWSEGPSGFGYGDGDDATVIEKTMAVYIRKKFTITDLEYIRDAYLHMDYDDGFVAYINGIEIARANVHGTPPAYNAGTPTDREATWYRNLPIEAFRIANIETILHEGENIICIQIHDANANSSDLTAIPIFSLGFSKILENPKPISSHIAIQNSNLQANFTISASNETIYLFKQNTIIDSVSISNLPRDVSIARPEGSKEFRYFSLPTPAKENFGNHFIAKTLDSPLISKKGGVSKTAVTVSLSTSEKNAYIRYTTDGSNPTNESPIYTSPIHIAKSKGLKAQVFREGYIPSSIQAESYIILSRTIHLPIVSITVKHEDFFDWNTGIYVEGPNAETHDPKYGANFWEDWEKPAFVQLFNTNGGLEFSYNLGVKIGGNYSRMLPQKSLKFYARSQYGDKAIEYQLFKDKPIYEFQTFGLRNSGNDFNNTQMRDGMIHSLVRNMGVDYLAYQPAIVYINGEYYGIQNLREKTNKHYIASNHGVHIDSISIMNVLWEVTHGSGQNYWELYTFMENNNLALPQNYERVKQDLDIENFIKYYLIEMYVVNEDWPGNNMRFWRENNSQGKWRYILQDLDFGFGIWNVNKAYNNMLTFTLTNDPSISWPNPPWSTLMLRKLVQNNEFNSLFMNHVADRLNTTFLPDSVHQHIDSLFAIIQPEIPYHAQRWNAWTQGFEINVDNMKTFASIRGDVMRSHFEQYYNTNGSYTLSLTSSHNAAGRIKINSIDIATGAWSGKYFKNNPIRITAIPAPGYSFVRWEGTINSTNPSIEITTANNIELHAVFSFNSNNIPSVYITELNYNSHPLYNSGEWIELYNAKETSQDISGWILRDQQYYNKYTIPQGTIIAPLSYLVICTDTSAFTSQYNTQNIQYTGNCTWNFANNGEVIFLYDANAFLQDKFAYSNKMPWPKKCDGFGYTLELIHKDIDRTNPLHWRAASWKGTPGKLNNPLELTPNRTDVVINEVNFNSHNSNDSGDWFELYNRGDFDIDISEWLIRDNKNNNIHIIPSFTSIQAHEYKIFCRNPYLFSIFYPNTPYMYTPLGLNNQSDGIRIYDQYEFLIDSVSYSIFSMNVLETSGTGRTLSLLSPFANNSFITNWAPSIYGGTPGRLNEFDIVQHTSPLQIPQSIFPNPCTTELQYTYTDVHEIKIYQLSGELIEIITNPSTHKIDTKQLNAGFYVIKITTSTHTFSHLIQKK